MFSLGQPGPTLLCPGVANPGKRMQVTVQTPCLTGAALAGLEAEWRALERQASASFFQSWSWIGCRVAERFVRPVLIRAVAEGRTVGLALFNRCPLPLARHALWLHQTGHTAEDSVFIEHNGPLVADGYGAAAPAILQAALRHGGVVVLSGIGQTLYEAACGLGRTTRLTRRAAPHAVLANQNAAAWQAARGTATRAQLRRSQRRLETLGPLRAERAATAPEALGFLAELARLHQAAWSGRGQPGAFAEPAFWRFHTELVTSGVPRGEVALWRISAGGQGVGYLYNFEWQGSVLSYQSGFDLAAVPRASPGLVAHAAAIGAAAGAGFGRYDFLAGDARFKRELSDAAIPLYWLELASVWQPRSLFHGAAAGLRQRLRKADHHKIPT